MYRKPLKVMEFEEGMTNTFQYVIWKVSLDSKTLDIIIIYQPPTSKCNKSTNLMFVSEFLDWLHDQMIQYRNIIIVGDINLHLNNNVDVEAGAFMDNIEETGLDFHSKLTTHKAGNTLDILITEESSNLRIKSCRPGPFL